MEQGADEVTGTDPTAGTRLRTDSAITIYKNPATMPTMTATETLVANMLEQNNLNVDVDSETGKSRVAWKTVARECIRAANASGINGLDGSDCGSLPIFVTGADASGPAKNDRQAIIGQPKWVLLHHWAAPAKSQWYRNKKVDTGPGCLDADNPKFADPQGTNCHEYPFWPTIQGYKGPLGPLDGGAIPRIMWTRGSQNQLQGRAFGHFLGTNPTAEFDNLFPRCISQR